MVGSVHKYLAIDHNLSYLLLITRLSVIYNHYKCDNLLWLLFVGLYGCIMSLIKCSMDLTSFILSSCQPLSVFSHFTWRQIVHLSKSSITPWFSLFFSILSVASLVGLGAEDPGYHLSNSAGVRPIGSRYDICLGVRKNSPLKIRLTEMTPPVLSPGCHYL